MGQLDRQKEETINQLILSTVPVVDRKIKEEESREQMELKRSKYSDQISVLRRRNQESRVVNEKEVERSRELMTIMKQHNSVHLKKSRQQN
jgi:hypothetical protein